MVPSSGLHVHIMCLTLSLDVQASISAVRAVDLEYDRPDLPEAMFEVLLHKLLQK